MTDVIPYIHIISDSTGETAVTMLKAALVHHQAEHIHVVRHKNIRTEDQVLNILNIAQKNKSLVVYTVINEEFAQYIQNQVQIYGLFSIDLLSPILQKMDLFLGTTPDTRKEVGKLRAVDENYFKRIEAIEFTVRFDDGKSLTGIEEADIILLGVSRTSKTPLSIYLSHKGLKVANIPIVLNQMPPDKIYQIDQKKIIALTIDIESLKKIRSNRAAKLGASADHDYASLAHIFNEIEFANELYKKNRRWPVINVTDKALEETAAEIIRIVGNRMGWTDCAF